MLLSLFLLACRSAPIAPIDSAGVLQPGFWTTFQGSLGCTGIHLTTWNAEGTVGMDIHIPGTPADRPTDTSLNIETRDAMVMVETGKEIPLNFCVDHIVEIPVQHVYHATKGTVHLSLLEYTDGHYATVKLSGIQLESEHGQHQITLPDIQLPDVLIGAKRTQTSTRPKIEHNTP